MMRVKKAVIPAAGLGTRFLPITKVVPKELLAIGNKPAIQYVVEEAVASGVEEIVLVCHRAKGAIVDYFRPNRELRRLLEESGRPEKIAELERIESMARFEVVFQEEPKGLGHAVWCARKAVGDEPFLVMLPDVLIAKDNPAALQLSEACGEGDWGVLLERVPNDSISAYGVIIGEEVSEGVYRVRGAVEKPSPEEAPSDLTLLGRYLFTPEIFDFIERLLPRWGGLGEENRDVTSSTPMSRPHVKPKHRLPPRASASVVSREATPASPVRGGKIEIQLTDAIDSLAKKRPGKGVVCHGKIFDVGTPEGLGKAYNVLG